jgi:hypothetical protein
MKAAPLQLGKTPDLERNSSWKLTKIGDSDKPPMN